MEKNYKIYKSKFNMGEEVYAYCFMDLKRKEVLMGRIEFELFADTPLTSENFRCLCTGEKGKGKSDVPLHYKGTRIHRIELGLLIQGGDITDNNGTGGESIYGYYFDDENFIHKHNRPFALCMANCGTKNTNGSQFYITMDKAP